MNKLKLHNKVFRMLVANFEEWLNVLGYSQSTVYYLPIHLREFFHWVEQNNIGQLTKITSATITGYYAYLQSRPNERRAGRLSKEYLNKHQYALKKFREYLELHNYYSFNVHLKSEHIPIQRKYRVLSQKEVLLLFDATRYSHHHTHFRIRDRAILTVLYSCGLRRNEAVNLDVEDLQFSKQRLFISKGKNNRERFVPVNSKNAKVLGEYLLKSRPAFLKNPSCKALFLNKNGGRLQGMSFANRLNAVIKATGDMEIEDKKITPHLLRHSIATHLLQSNVPLELIKSFLGHTSLVSTQHYTHLLEKLEYELI